MFMEKVIDRPILDVVLDRLKIHLVNYKSVEEFWDKFGLYAPEMATIYSYSPDSEKDYHPLNAARETFYELVNLIGPDNADEYLNKFVDEVGLDPLIFNDFIYSYKDIDFRTREIIKVIKPLAEQLSGSYRMKELISSDRKLIIGIEVLERKLNKLVLELIELIGVEEFEGSSVGKMLKGVVAIDPQKEGV